MKRDGTSIPLADSSWGNKKLLDLAISTKDHSAVNLGYVNEKTEKIKNDANAVSIKSEYINYSGIFLISNPFLTTYIESSNIINTVKDINQKYTFNCTTDQVKLLKDTTVNKLFSNITVPGNISAVNVSSEDIHTNDCLTVIMIFKTEFLSTATTLQEYLTYGTNDTTEFSIVANNVNSATVLNMFYGSDSLVYSIPSASSYNNKPIAVGFRKDGVEGKLCFNGSNFITKTNMAYSIPKNFNGSLMFGVGVETDIYEVHIFNKALTNYEMDMYMTQLTL